MRMAKVIALDGYLAHVRNFYIAHHLANGVSRQKAEEMTKAVADFMRAEIVAGRARIKWIDGHVAIQRDDVEEMVRKTEAKGADIRARGDQT